MGKHYLLNLYGCSFVLLDDERCLIDLLENKSPSIAQVFFNSKEKAVHVYKELLDRNYSVGCIHGELSQGERDNIMKMFKESKIKILFLFQ